MSRDDLRLAVLSRHGDDQLSVEHHEHIYLSLTAAEQALIRGNDLLLTIRAKSLDHLLRERRKGQLRPKLRNKRCGREIAFLLRHKRPGFAVDSVTLSCFTGKAIAVAHR